MAAAADVRGTNATNKISTFTSVGDYGASFTPGGNDTNSMLATAYTYGTTSSVTIPFAMVSR